MPDDAAAPAATRKRDYKAEHARRKARAAAQVEVKAKAKAKGRSARRWTLQRRAKFLATMKMKKAGKKLRGAPTGKRYSDLNADERRAYNRAAYARQKAAKKNGSGDPVMQAKGNRLPPTIQVVEPDGNLRVYVLATVRAYVRQPGQG
jgi:hypothetical protein